MGKLKWEDRPLWFDAYIAHPPLQEPVWDIRMPKRGEPIPKIFYHDDIGRACVSLLFRIEIMLNLLKNNMRLFRKEMFDKIGKQPKHKLHLKQQQQDLDDAYAVDMNDDDYVEKK